ncbi:hypothetical protein D3C72_2015180 [compost metagenome]
MTERLPTASTRPPIFSATRPAVMSISPPADSRPPLTVVVEEAEVRHTIMHVRERCAAPLVTPSVRNVSAALTTIEPLLA